MTLPMTCEDMIRFYQATPIGLWPILWPRLHGLRALMDERMASGTGGLTHIFTDGRGGLRIEWIVREETLSRSGLQFERSGNREIADLDGRSRAFEARCGWFVREDCSRDDLIFANVGAPLEPG